MDGKEIEIKIELNRREYDNMLSSLKATSVFLKEKHQVDVYYSPFGENYYDFGDRCLRVRTEDDHTLISYKRIYNENTDNQYIEEYETQIGNSTTMDNILRAVNLKKEIIVDKHRFEFIYQNDYFIALDHVKELGYFIEIENTNEQKSIEIRNCDLLNVIQKLGLNIHRRNQEGYSNMLYRKTTEDKDD